MAGAVLSMKVCRRFKCRSSIELCAKNPPLRQAAER